jgi:hypothetical protein
MNGGNITPNFDLVSGYGAWNTSCSSAIQIESPGWKSWKWFNKGRLADAGADLVCEGKNDLVVDTQSMTQFAAGSVFPAGTLHDFSTNAEVHHCNHSGSEAT